MIPKDDASVKRLNLIYEHETYRIGLSHILECLDGHIEILLKHITGDGSCRNPYICPVPGKLLGRITSARAACIRYLAGLVFFDAVQEKRYQYFIREKKTAKRNSYYLDYKFDDNTVEFNKLRDSFALLTEAFPRSSYKKLNIPGDDIYRKALDHDILNRVQPENRFQLLEGINLVKKHDPTYRDPLKNQTTAKETLKDSIGNNMLLVIMGCFLIIAILGAICLKSCSHNHGYRSSSHHYIEREVEGGRYRGL